VLQHMNHTTTQKHVCTCALGAIYALYVTWSTGGRARAEPCSHQTPAKLNATTASAAVQDSLKDAERTVDTHNSLLHQLTFKTQQT
jgi:hypothetical protein